MPAITYDDFSGGLDRRLPINVQEASRLWVLRNAFITQGKRIKKRPCLRLVTTGLDGSLGLEAISGRLKVFHTAGDTFTAPSDVDAVALSQPAFLPPLIDVVDVALFQGFAYVVAAYIDTFNSPSGPVPIRVYRHHYVDANPSTLITDVNCPQTDSITVAASRIFAIGEETVRYCAAGDARDWTTASDAGFLPTGLQQNTKTFCTAVGTFEDALVVFFPEGAQIWDVAVDPSANQIRKRIYGVGTTYPQTLANWASDLAFLSPFGFRSMTVTEQTDRIDDTDVGVQIDPLVQADIVTSEGLPEDNRQRTFGAWIPQLGQYWCIFDTGTSSKVWAFTYSRTSKIACWSEYTFPVRITGLATLNGKVYVRTADSLYEIDATRGSDAGTVPSVEVQMAFQDAKSPGVLKQLWGGDFVFSGTWSMAIKYDPRDQSKETIVQQLTGDTRPGDIVPVEVCAAAVAPVFRHTSDEAAELSAVTLYYNLLGVVG